MHHHAIVGETQIIGSEAVDGKNFYHFDTFHEYPHPVQLELLKTDARLPKLSNHGNWFSIYVTREAIEEIRTLSKLPKEERKKLGEDLRNTIEALESLASLRSYETSWEFRLRRERLKLICKHELDTRILDQAENFLLQARERELSLGHPLEVLFYAALYLALRMSNVPVLLDDLAEMTDAKPRRIGKLYRLLARELNLTVPLLRPEHIVEARSRTLNVSDRTTRRAISFAQRFNESMDAIGKAPSSIAAAALFAACQEEGEGLKKTEIAQAFSVSSVTIRNRLKEITSNPRVPAREGISELE
jgi:transcription initiation factor TFIIIB Brf1 subunit/transcription initiation factor TFIIB